MKTYILFFIILLFSFPVYAQKVGINTDTPTSALDIKAASSDSNNKAVRAINSEGSEVFTILNNGNIGVGVPDPKVRLDIRNTNRKAEIGIGDTDMNPSVVGPGAIRCSSDLSQLHFSTGSEWLRFTSSLERPYVITKNNATGGSYPNKTICPLTGFKKVQDSYNSFNEDSTLYIVPIEGVYIFSFTIGFKESMVEPDSYIEAYWATSAGDTIKSIRYFPVGGTGVASISCYGSLRLSVGDTIRPMIYHTLGETKELITYSNDDTQLNYNNIFIFAL